MTHLPPGTQGPATPDYIVTLINRLLEGDQEMAALLRTPTSQLFAAGSPPSAIRTRFWEYRYSQAPELVRHGLWWQRELLPELGEIFLPATHAASVIHQGSGPRAAEDGVEGTGWGIGAGDGGRGLRHQGVPERDWALFWLSLGLTVKVQWLRLTRRDRRHVWGRSEPRHGGHALARPIFAGARVWWAGGVAEAVGERAGWVELGAWGVSLVAVLLAGSTLSSWSAVMCWCPLGVTLVLLRVLPPALPLCAGQ